MKGGIIFRDCSVVEKDTSDTIFIFVRPTYDFDKTKVHKWKNLLYRIKSFISDKDEIHITSLKRYDVYISFLCQYIMMIYKSGKIIFDRVEFLPEKRDDGIRSHLIYDVKNYYKMCSILNVFKIAIECNEREERNECNEYTLCTNKDVKIVFENCNNEWILEDINESRCWKYIPDSYDTENLYEILKNIDGYAVPVKNDYTLVEPPPTNKYKNGVVELDLSGKITSCNNNNYIHPSIKKFDYFVSNYNKNNAIDVLNLEQCHLQDEDVLHLVELLKKIKKDEKIKTVNLRCNEIYGYVCTDMIELIIKEYARTIDLTINPFAGNKNKKYFGSDSYLLNAEIQNGLIWIPRSWIDSDGWKKMIPEDTLNRDEIIDRITKVHENYYRN